MNTAVSEAGKTAVEHAAEAAEAIRAINHVTYQAESLPYPSDAWRLLNPFASTTHRLGQALQQTGNLVGGKHERGEIGIDHGTAYAGHPEMAVEDCLTGLQDAVQASGLLAEALERAARPLTYAHYLDPVVRDSDDRDEDMGTDVTGENRS
jgi:hypothetical protein